MLFPFTRVWTPRQKVLIVGSVVLALVSFGACIYGYERYYRGPGQEILYGTWHNSDGLDSTIDLTLYSDHTFIDSGEGMGRYWINDTGKWYADFNRIFFFGRRDFDKPPFEVLRLAGVTDNELKTTDGKWVMTFIRKKTLTREELQSMADKAD